MRKSAPFGLKIALVSAYVLLFGTCLLCAVLLYQGKEDFAFIDLTTNLREMLLYFAALNACYLVFKERLSYSISLLFFVIGAFISHVGLFDRILFETLRDFGVFSVQTNAQMLNVIVFSAASGLFGIKFFIGRKTFDRFFFALLLTVMAVTLTIFHRVTAQGSLMKYQDHLFGRIERVLAFPDFEDACKLANFECFAKEADTFRFFGGETYAIKHFFRLAQDEDFAPPGDVKTGRFYDEEKGQDFRYAFASASAYNEKRYVLARTGLEEFRQGQLFFFNFLSLSAHGFWTFFTLFLIFYHNNLSFFRKRFRPL